MSTIHVPVWQEAGRRRHVPGSATGFAARGSRHLDPNDLSQRLTRIQTRWTLVFRAHQGQGGAWAEARQQLLLRYYGAVYRYLLGTLRDPDVAEELTQEFAVRFLRGDFKRATPQRGRFRDFLKAAARHLAIKHWQRTERRKKKGPRPLPQDSDAGAARFPEDSDSDREFHHAWREELLARTWEALAQAQEETGRPYHAVLRFKTEYPQARSAELAERL